MSDEHTGSGGGLAVAASPQYEQMLRSWEAHFGSDHSSDEAGRELTAIRQITGRALSERDGMTELTGSELASLTFRRLRAVMPFACRSDAGEIVGVRVLHARLEDWLSAEFGVKLSLRLRQLERGTKFVLQVKTS